MKSIKSLLSKYNGRIYVFLTNESVSKQFLKNAELEGFTFDDGTKPTSRKADFIFAINKNMTINYVGFVGHIAFQAASKIGNEPLIKIDYEKMLKS